MANKDINSEIFNFHKREIDFFILRKLNIAKKFKTSFAYVFEKLLPMNISNEKSFLTNTSFDLENLVWREGKNYHWIALTDNIEKPTTQLIIRHYGNHFTVYFKYKYIISDEDINDYFTTRSGVFTFYTNIDNLSDTLHDSYIEDRFKDLNLYLPMIINLMKEDSISSIWNSYSLKLDNEEQRPKHIEAKCSWDGGDTIDSIDDIIFSVEELFQTHLEIFAETDMLNHLKTLQIGDKIGSNTITRIETNVEDDYFHDAGLEMTDSRNDTKWQDVYALTRWHYDEVFPTIEEKTN